MAMDKVDWLLIGMQTFCIVCLEHVQCVHAHEESRAYVAFEVLSCLMGASCCCNSFDIYAYIGLVLCSLHEDSDESMALVKRLIDRCLGLQEHWPFAQVNLSHVATAFLMLSITCS